MLVASVDRGGPHLAEDDVPGFGIPVFRDGVFRVADLHTVINFTIRYRPDVKPGMWVLFGGEKWEISTLGEYAFTKAYLGLKASVAKGVSG